MEKDYGNKLIITMMNLMSILLNMVTIYFYQAGP